MITLDIPSGKVSDGYHTFDELYDHRCALFALLCLNLSQHQVYQKKDGDDWFVLFLMLPTGQVSYHLPIKFYESFKKYPLAPEGLFDGHTSKAVLSRIIMAVESSK